MGFLIALGQSIAQTLLELLLHAIAGRSARMRGFVWACPACGGHRLQRHQSAGYSMLVFALSILVIVPLTLLGLAALVVTVAGGLGLVGVLDDTGAGTAVLYLLGGAAGLAAWTVGMGATFLVVARKPPKRCRDCKTLFPLTAV